ncbi:MAG: noncanonical pyrimidine nucleotidase, YjjG family [Flavobacteriaceae bacterium]|nr:noncanonical pyrimidine nucleotidase, YjjG family [Flavobacteriaceae bacterium]
MIKHIFFDLDHTLWDFETNSAKAFEHIFEVNNIETNLIEFLGCYKSINEHYWKLYREDRISKPDLRYGRLKDAFMKVEYDLGDELIHKLSVEYLNHLPNHNTLFEGTISILEYLCAKYTLHIITNGFYEVQHLKLSRSNIITYFDKVITSESVGVKKPNPRIFNHALTLANATPNESMMIGDSVEADVLGAMNVNMNAIHFNYDSRSVDAAVTSINKLEELKHIL